MSFEEKFWLFAMPFWLFPSREEVSTTSCAAVMRAMEMNILVGFQQSWGETFTLVLIRPKEYHSMITLLCTPPLSASLSHYRNRLTSRSCIRWRPMSADRSRFIKGSSSVKFNLENVRTRGFPFGLLWSIPKRKILIFLPSKFRVGQVFTEFFEKYFRAVNWWVNDNAETHQQCIADEKRETERQHSKRVHTRTVTKDGKDSYQNPY